MPQHITTWKDLFKPGRAVDFFTRRAFPSFNVNANGYNRDNALWLAELSRLVYRHDIEEEIHPPQPTRASFVEKAGFKQRAFFISEKMDTQAMLVVSTASPPFAVLVFRGTERLKDFLNGIKVGVPPLDQHKISEHQGFSDALEPVWNNINDELAKLTCPVYYTGHSLGAALATLAAARRAPRAVYTFGSPRVGNAPFVASLGRIPIHRIVDDKDLVTTLPPEDLGFRHAGAIQLLTEPPLGALLTRLGRLWGPPKTLADHAPINYVDRI